MQTLERKNIFFKVFFGGDSNPGQIDDFHLMRLFGLSIYLRNITNLSTVIQKFTKKTKNLRVHPKGLFAVTARAFR